MENLRSWADVTYQSIGSFGEKFMETLPGIIGALLLIIIGWLIARLIQFLIVKLLAKIKFDNYFLKLNKTQEAENEWIERVKPSYIVGRFVYWVILLLFFISASETLGWIAVSSEISRLMNFLPKLFIGIIIFVIGYYVATIVKKAIHSGLNALGIEYGNILGNVAFYIILIIIAITSLDQLGIETSLITSNLLIILIAVLATFAISFGFASKDFISNFLSTYYSKENFKVGQEIKINDIHGTIEKINKLQCVIKSKDSKIVIPTSELINNKVEIIEH